MITRKRGKLIRLRRPNGVLWLLNFVPKSLDAAHLACR
jgi:hypothetical protein